MSKKTAWVYYRNKKNLPAFISSYVNFGVNERLKYFTEPNFVSFQMLGW